MMGVDLAALLGLFGLSSAVATLALVLAAWMCWRIAEKAGLPGWSGAITIVLTVTGIGGLVSLILLWVFAFMRWPRDGAARWAAMGGTAPVPAPPRAGGGVALLPSPEVLAPSQTELGAPAGRAPDRRRWMLVGGGVSLVFDDGGTHYTLTGEQSGAADELVVPDPSVGRPHARLLTAVGRIGLFDLGTRGGTMIDGVKLGVSDGPRDITAARVIKLGNVELALSRT
jgi:hypothetical protein